jgi:hypothetical protein
MTVEPLDQSYRDFLKQQWDILYKTLSQSPIPSKHDTIPP